MKTLVQRLASALPPGTLQVAVGTGIFGIASYVHLGVVGHTLDVNGKAAVSVLWTIALSVGYGFYLPVEQEITRITAARVTTGEGTASILARGAALAFGILAVVWIVLAAAFGTVARLLFNGDRSMVLALGGAFAGLAVTAVIRGVLAGHGRFQGYALQMGVDGGLRIVFALALGLSGVRSAALYSLILTVAPVLAALLVLRGALRTVRPGADAVPWPEMSRGLSMLVGSTMLNQIVLGAAVVSVKLIEPGRTELIAALLSAIVLARVPLFVFQSLQTALLPGLAAAYASGDRAGFGSLVKRSCGTVLVLGVGGGVCAAALGPKLIHTFLGAPDVLGSSDFAYLSLGTLCYMLALVLGTGLMAQHRHRAQLVCWAVGAAALAAVTLAPGDIRTRVELAYVAGSLASALSMGYSLFRRRTDPEIRSAGNLRGRTAAAPAVPGPTMTAQADQTGITKAGVG